MYIIIIHTYKNISVLQDPITTIFDILFVTKLYYYSNLKFKILENIIKYINKKRYVQLNFCFNL